MVSIFAGREKELQNKEEADVLYKHVKGEVERGLEYLQVLPLDLTTVYSASKCCLVFEPSNNHSLVVILFSLSTSQKL